MTKNFVVLVIIFICHIFVSNGFDDDIRERTEELDSEVSDSHRSHGQPDLCQDSTIDSAVRISAKKDMFVFKDNYYWILNTETYSLSAGRLIAEEFNVSETMVELNRVENTWIYSGFDEKDLNSGQMVLLKKPILHIFDVKFDTEGKHDIHLHSLVDISVFWPQFQNYNKIDAISQLNTFHDYFVYRYNTVPDLLVFSDDWYAILWSNRSEELHFDTKHEFYAKSEKNSSRLSIFDHKTRGQNYWNKIESEPISNVLEIRALVFYPIPQHMYVIGRQHFCIINLKKSALNVKCNKKSIKILFGCERDPMAATPTSRVGQPSQTPKLVANLNSKNKSVKSITYWMVGLLILIFIVGIVTILCFTFGWKRSSKGYNKRKSKTKPLTQDSIDPRYGQIDSNINLTLKIATPSAVDLKPRQTANTENSSSKSNKK